MNLDEIIILANKVSKFKDIYNLYPWSEVAYKLREHYNFVDVDNHKCPLCNKQLLTVYGMPNNGTIYICTSCESQYDANYKLLQNDYVINTEYINSINPFTLLLVQLLESIGCSVTFHNDIGDYGVLLFEYNSRILGIWLDDTYAINIFYPNWSIIPSSDLSATIVNAIQTYNLNNQVCVYWLYKDDSYTFSSNLTVDINLVNENAIEHIKGCLCKLIDSKEELLKSIHISEFKRHEIQFDSITNIISALQACNCESISVDDDGDVQFIWNNNHMYVHAIDNHNIKIVHNLVTLEDVKTTNATDNVDTTALSIQWSNMIWAVKCSYNHLDKRHTSITTFINIDVSHFINGDSKFISRTLNELCSFYDDCLTDLIYGTERGCSILDSCYQPYIKNYDSIKEYSDIREVPEEVINKCILKFKELFTRDSIQKYGDDFHWIERIINLTSPSFHLFSFRIGQCAFSCRVAIIDNDIRFDNGTWQFKIVNYSNYCGNDERLKICKDNNLIPCIIVLDIKGKQNPAFTLDEGDAMDPFDIDEYVSQNNNSKIILSKYELRIMARSTILDYLNENNMILQAISNMPEMMPAMYCSQSGNYIAIVDKIFVNNQSTKTDINRDNIKMLLSQDYLIKAFNMNIDSDDFIKGKSDIIYRGDKVTISIGSTYELDESTLPFFDEVNNDCIESPLQITHEQKQSWISRITQFFYRHHK